MWRWLVVGGFVLIAIRAGAGEAPVPGSDRDKMSYAIGVDLGQTVKQQMVEVDPGFLIQGLTAGLSGSTYVLSDDELRRGVATYKSQVRVRQNELKQKIASAGKTLPEDNRKAGDAFRAANKTREGVVTLPSGLQYKVLKTGDGKMPAETDTIECHYRGRFVSGTEFDSSYRKGKPATFKVSGVIDGWKEALALMPAGSRWELVVPPSLAYGEAGAPPAIGPNATLVFDLELLAVK